MKSVLFILPYFGKFPNYFQLFLNSCNANPTIDWLLVTDNSMNEFYLPANVIIKRSSFKDIQQLIFKRFQTNIIAPYELCKYRVAYIDLFLEAHSYDFWGYCDCDLIWGNLRIFLTEDILQNYDKIAWRGHMTLFKTSHNINSAYKVKIAGFKTFKGCIENTEGINLFDEVGINKIFDYLGLKIYKSIPFADLKIRSANFKCLHNIFPQETNQLQIFSWSNERGLERIYLLKGQIKKEAIAYVHFLKRPMEMKREDLKCSFLIIPNGFIDNRIITIKEIKKYARKKIYWSYWLHRINYTFIRNKINYLLHNKNNQPDKYC